MDKLKFLFALAGSVVGGFFGDWNGFVFALLAFIVTDYITGVIRAINERQLSSAVGFKGLAKKVCILALMGVGNIIDRQIIGTGGAVRDVVIFFYLSNEGISIVENIAAVGVPVPERIVEVLRQIKGGKGEEGK